MNKIIGWIKHQTIWFLTGLITLFGAVSTRLATCTSQTTLAVAQVATNPTNQLATVEAASFVANLFYQGANDPFPTHGAGGELGKASHVVLKKGQKLFGEAITKIIAKTDDILISSRRWDSPQIQVGKRAIQKKQGSAIREGYSSAFSDIPITQKNAEKLINDIIQNADIVVIRPQTNKSLFAKW